MTLPTPPRRTSELFALTVAVALAGAAVVGLVVGEWWYALLMTWLAVALYSAVRTSRLAWQAGYLTARAQLWNGLAEAQRRRLSPEQWLQAELERDTAAGITRARWRKRGDGEAQSAGD